MPSDFTSNAKAEPRAKVTKASKWRSKASPRIAPRRVCRMGQDVERRIYVDTAGGGGVAGFFSGEFPSRAALKGKCYARAGPGFEGCARNLLLRVSSRGCFPSQFPLQVWSPAGCHVHC